MPLLPDSRSVETTESPEFSGESIGTRWSYESPNANAITDTREELETPEGAIIQLHPAGPSARAAAFLVDELIKLVVMVFIGMFVGTLMQNSVGLLIMYLSFFVLNWLYGVLFEVFNDGRTLGKNVVNLKTVNADGTPIRFGASVLRNLFRFVDVLPLCIPALVSMTMSDGFRRIGDHVADTVVVYSARQSRTAKSVPSAARPLPVSLNNQEQLLLTDFHDRAGTLSSARATELAELLQPLHGETGQKAVDAVNGYAAGIRGSS